MEIVENQKIGKFCWLNEKIYEGGGENIRTLYLPNTVEEFECLLSKFIHESKPFLVFGHTSNCYFMPSFHTETIISTRHLYRYEIKEKCVVCEPGVPTKKIAQELTSLGYKGYSGMIDLPGTIAAAVFGNAGCFGCETKDIIESVDIICPDGSIRTLHSDDLKFRRRSSALKRKEIEGVIISVSLKMSPGNKTLLSEHAEICHKERMLHQPGPANNLGSCFMSGKKSICLRILERLILWIGKPLKLNEHQRLEILLTLYNKKDLIPYLFDLNRFMFIDKNAHEKFNEYVSFYKKIYKKASLEIQIFK